MKLLEVKHPLNARVPILISSPHSGYLIPEPLKNEYKEEVLKDLDDTDWFLPQLYNFALDMGITIVDAQLSRWVIDLNRNPKSQPLYTDGRLITGLCPTTDFLGNKLYHEGHEPNDDEIQQRLRNYYYPYYQKVQAILNDLKEEFGQVLLYDAHSIRSVVPTIQKERFPDFVLGTADEKSANQNVINAALLGLNTGDYQVNHNSPFKGGHITRFFGQPNENQHALQLERCKDLYMDNDEKNFDETKANKMRIVLENMFEKLIDQLS